MNNPVYRTELFFFPTKVDMREKKQTKKKKQGLDYPPKS